VFFISMAATHMTIFQLNRRRNHKFFFSALLFGFCMARIVALTTRIAWALHPHSLDIAIAAGIFTQAGVLLLFVVNLLFSQRILRAYQPNLGWHPAAKYIFLLLLFLVVILLIMVITATVHMFFTLSPTARSADRAIQLFCGTGLTVIAFIPIPIILLASLLPRKTRIEKFGQGRFRTKIRLVFSTATLLTLGAAFRLGAAFAAPPADSPEWFDSRACFYIFNFTLEAVVVFVYAVTRFDRRFHVPNGSYAPGHYAGGLQRLTFSDCINRETDLFGDVAEIAQGGATVTSGNSASTATATEEERSRQWTEKARRELYGTERELFAREGDGYTSQSEYFSAEEN
jgi:MFS family permease